MTLVPKLSLGQASAGDISWIVELEARPEFEAFIHRWPHEEHTANLSRRDMRYLMMSDERGQRAGFVILAGLKNRARSIELVRIAIAEPGRGLARHLLPLIVSYAFTSLSANRLWLDVFDDNERARRAYMRAGFREEGVLREASLKTSGTLGSLVIMSILASEVRNLQG